MTYTRKLKAILNNPGVLIERIVAEKPHREPAIFFFTSIIISSLVLVISLFIASPSSITEINILPDLFISLFVDISPTILGIISITYYVITRTLGVLIGAIILKVFAGIFGGRGSYKQALTITAYAAGIVVIIEALRTELVRVAMKMDITNPILIFFTAMIFLPFEMFVLIRAIGFQVKSLMFLYGMEKGKAVQAVFTPIAVLFIIVFLSFTWHPSKSRFNYSVYRDSDLGFSIHYPQEWSKWSEDRGEGSRNIIFANVDIFQFDKPVMERKIKTTIFDDQLLNVPCAMSIDALPGATSGGLDLNAFAAIDDPRLTNYKEAAVGGELALTRGPADYKFIHQETLYETSTERGMSKICMDLLDSMVKTIDFFDVTKMRDTLEEEGASNWTEYEDASLKIAFRLPSGWKVEEGWEGCCRMRLTGVALPEMSNSGQPYTIFVNKLLITPSNAEKYPKGILTVEDLREFLKSNSSYSGEGPRYKGDPESNTRFFIVNGFDALYREVSYPESNHPSHEVYLLSGQGTVIEISFGRDAGGHELRISQEEKEKIFDPIIATFIFNPDSLTKTVSNCEFLTPKGLEFDLGTVRRGDYIGSFIVTSISRKLFTTPFTEKQILYSGSVSFSGNIKVRGSYSGGKNYFSIFEEDSAKLPYYPVRDFMCLDLFSLRGDPVSKLDFERGGEATVVLGDLTYDYPACVECDSKPDHATLIEIIEDYPNLGVEASGE